MTYEIRLHAAGVLQRDMPLALTMARQVLEQRLGGPAGVVQAYRAIVGLIGPDRRLRPKSSLGTDDLVAVLRWRRSVNAVFERIYAEFQVDVESPWFGALAAESWMSIDLTELGTLDWRQVAPVFTDTADRGGPTSVRRLQLQPQ